MHAPSILMVEDDPNNHPLFHDVFTKAGFLVTILPDADGAFLDTVASTKPDIVSMDLMIGKDGTDAERDGLTAISAMKSDLRTADVPVMVLSNFFEEGKVSRAKELGAVDYINLATYDIKKIPEFFKAYLENPNGYKPAHPAFRND